MFSLFSKYRSVTRLTVPLTVVVTLIASTLGVWRVNQAFAGSGACNLSGAAFCETFSSAYPVTTNSGQLNGTVWGVSRANSAGVPSQGLLYAWADVAMDRCGSTVDVAPPNDVAVCNGRLVEAVNDNGGQTVLAAYPRQPFDVAGRTGTVSFDVSNNTQGIHAAWPAFVYSDQPVPAPYGHASGINDTPRNSFGMSFANLCQAGNYCGTNVSSDFGQAGVTCWSVSDMWFTRNYQYTDLTVDGFASPSAVDGCVDEPTGPDGALNTVQVHLSAAGVTVFAGDPGSSSLRQIAHMDTSVDPAFVLPLTRGLAWLEDVHYNGNKFNSQQSNTFAWDNMGFDGPVLTQDRGFDVLENAAGGPPAENGLPTQNIGWDIGAASAPTLSTLPVDSASLAAASGAIVTLVSWPTSAATLSYAINGNPYQSFAWPFGSTGTWVSQTVALPVPLSQVRPGVNTIDLRTSDGSGVAVASLDLILVGGGGAPRAESAAIPAAGRSTVPTVNPAPSGHPAATATALPGREHIFTLTCTQSGSSVTCSGQAG